MQVDLFFKFDQSLVKFLSSLEKLREGVDVVLVILSYLDL